MRGGSRAEQIERRIEPRCKPRRWPPVGQHLIAGNDNEICGPRAVDEPIGRDQRGGKYEKAERSHQRPRAAFHGYAAGAGAVFGRFGTAARTPPNTMSPASPNSASVYSIPLGPKRSCAQPSIVVM